MARSTYIYLVTDSDIPMAAFTVKREMEAWISTRKDPSLYRKFRMRDGLGPDKVPVEMEVSMGDGVRKSGHRLDVRKSGPPFSFPVIWCDNCEQYVPADVSGAKGWGGSHGCPGMFEKRAVYPDEW